MSVESSNTFDVSEVFLPEHQIRVRRAGSAAGAERVRVFNYTIVGRIRDEDDNNGGNGTTCASSDSCGLVPIGLDSHTTYVDQTQITLQQGHQWRALRPQ